MEDAKGKAAQILDPLLSHFCTIEDQQLRAVSYFYDSGLLEAIILDFISVSLDLKVEPDDDTISFGVNEIDGLCRTGYVDASVLEPWDRLIGKPFGWGWVTIGETQGSYRLSSQRGAMIGQNRHAVHADA
jgi:hypothetical protein